MKKAFNASNVTTLISKATEITGDIHFSGTLEVEGKIEGNRICRLQLRLVYAERLGAAEELAARMAHAVNNPLHTLTGAIHVYGGDITARPGRSEWDDDSGDEVTYDFERTRRYFASFQTPAVTN